MNFLTAAKELKEAQAQLAEKEAAIETANAEIAKLKADGESAIASVLEITNKLEAAEAQLKAANENLSALKAESLENAAKIEAAAAAKSGATVAALGHEPVKADTAPSNNDVKAIYAAMKPGPERDAFRKQHPKHFSLN